MQPAPGEFARSGNGLDHLLGTIRSCAVCAPHLPQGPKPVLRAHLSARILLIGQAPGARVHATGIPWNDPSGDRLREWLAISRAQFYDESVFAIIPMGFCYPGKGKGGDKPPRPECAPLWHAKLHALLPNIKLTLLIGAYAIARYLPECAGLPIQRCLQLTDFAQSPVLPLVHPSPRNKLWLKRNPWFEEKLLPLLQKRLRSVL